MSHRVFAAVFLAATLSIGTSFAASPANSSNTTASPVAFVYVTGNSVGNTNRIWGYAAAADGTLTPTPYTPYPANVYPVNTSLAQIAVNGKYLFATGNGPNGSYVYSLSIGPHGYLTPRETANVRTFPDSTCATAGDLAVDHTGASLYPFINNADCSGTDNAYMSLKIANSTGKLSYISRTLPRNSNASTYYGYPLTFLANNQWAYNVACVSGSPSFMGLKRHINGSLTNESISASLPSAPPTSYYCADYVAAGTTNHLAMDVMLPNIGGMSQIASYTANTSNGNLTTNSTYDNMPFVTVGGTNPPNGSGVYTMQTSPAGNLLAVGGTTGLQIFHFNGAAPATNYNTGTLTTNQIDHVFWDNANHLYAISNSGGKLFVFTITPTSAKQAPGSPYTIMKPAGLVVLSR